MEDEKLNYFHGPDHRTIKDYFGYIRGCYTAAKNRSPKNALIVKEKFQEILKEYNDYSSGVEILKDQEAVNAYYDRLEQYVLFFDKYD